MKKFFTLLLLAVLVTTLYGEIPPRVFEVGFDVEAGFANNIIGLTDIFWTPNQKILIDLDKLPKGAMGLDLLGSFKGVMNITVGDYRFGSFTGMDTIAYGAVDGLGELLAEGYSGDATIDISSGASAFVYTSLWGDFGIPSLEGWKFYAAPAYYIPLIYTQTRDSDFHLRTITDENEKDILQFGGSFDTRVYTPFSMENASISPGALTQAGGLDISLGAEYSLASLVGFNLDVGSLISHIPLVPARLANQMTMLYSMEDMNLDLLEAVLNGNMPEMAANSESVYGDANFAAFRPLEFDFYALYRPFESDLITVKPLLGFSVLTVYGAGFNAGVSAALSAGVGSMELSTQYRNRLWRHALDFVLDLRVFELDFGIGLQSQSFLKSFALGGLTVSLGFRLGVPKINKRVSPARPPQSPAPDPTQQAKDVFQRYENDEPEEFPGFEAAAGITPAVEPAPEPEIPPVEAAPPEAEAGLINIEE
jgi:hypothetical protein